MANKRTHIVIPEALAAEIDRFAGRRARSRFLIQAAERELLIARQIKALEKAAGAWQDENHPELKNGSAAWVRKMRRESEHRFHKIMRRR